MATILTPSSISVEGSFDQQIAWQAAMKAAIRSAHTLCEQLGVDPQLACPEAESDFPVFAPQEWVRRIKPNDAHDPLLRQVLAIQEERQEQGEMDPVGDLDSQRGSGLLQKYAGRVLLVTTGACAIHCRYCFRRHFPYSETPKGRQGWETWLSSIADDTSIEEVILSGGDPLTIADSHLAWLSSRLDAIEHVQRLRIHTRVPVVIPQRVCGELLRWLTESRLRTILVLHINHAQEIDSLVDLAVEKLRSAGVVLLNQSVLLKGVNDSVQALKELSLALVDRGIVPYYLHQLDPVRGGMHFEVDDDRAIKLIEDLRGKLPGYAVPRLVREQAGEPSKTVIR
ncbi:MAG: EF-P beta-lysylation protein EpmB [bacterium]|nr:EF-P beta-lysylation protein EpmB [bacterium]